MHLHGCARTLFMFYGAKVLKKHETTKHFCVKIHRCLKKIEMTAEQATIETT